jgi:hypothetical protein
MADKAKTAAPAKADDKPKPLFPALDKGVDENGLRWEKVDVLGTLYTVRELTTQEEDDAFDAAELPDDKINARLERRLRLCSAITSPSVTVDDIALWPGLRTRSLMFVMDRINSLPPADAEGNA